MRYIIFMVAVLLSINCKAQNTPFAFRQNDVSLAYVNVENFLYLAHEIIAPQNVKSASCSHGYLTYLCNDKWLYCCDQLGRDTLVITLKNGHKYETSVEVIEQPDLRIEWALSGSREIIGICLVPDFCSNLYDKFKPMARIEYSAIKYTVTISHGDFILLEEKVIGNRFSYRVSNILQEGLQDGDIVTITVEEAISSYDGRIRSLEPQSSLAYTFNGKVRLW